MFSSNDNLYERYEHNLPVAISCLVLFTLMTLYHYGRYRVTGHTFGAPMYIGGVFEIIAFAARIISIQHPDDKVSFIVQRSLMLLAPLWYTSAIYDFFDGLMYGSGYSNLSLFWHVRQTLSLVGSNCVCLSLHFCGLMVLYFAPKPLRMLGKMFIFTGLGIQIAALLIFLLFIAVFNYRVIRRGLLDRINPHVRLIPMTTMVYMFTCHMLVRNSFRVMEMVDGVNGHLISHEWIMYVFDISVMGIIMISTSAWYKEDLELKRFNTNLWYVSHDGELEPWRDSQR